MTAAEHIVAVSVVIATYNRTDSLRQLLGQLADQTLAPALYDVIVVDDGSREPVAPVLATLAPSLPYRLVALSQANAGPGAARNTGVAAADGSVIVIVDDDMRIPPTFLAAHLASHPAGSRRVTLGVLRPPRDVRQPLFERYQMVMWQRLYDHAAAGGVIHGWSLYTGNVSFRRDDYLAVGGFDRTLRLSEDAELGIRLEASGVEFQVSADAWAENASDHASLSAWMRRSEAYGQSDARIADKHPELPAASPWRFLPLLHPISRPIMHLALRAPSLMAPVARLAMRAAQGCAALGLERVAIAGATFVYGVQYYRGVRAWHGSWPTTQASLRAYQQPATPTAAVASSTPQPS